MSYEKKVAIVTGASQGLGAGIVRAYRKLGYSVIANSRTIKQPEDADVIAVAGDIGNRDLAKKLIDTAINRFGRVDTLINNAGIFIPKPFTDYTVEDLSTIYHTNVHGFFHVTQFALEEMLKKRSGHIVQITTTLVHQAISGVPAGLTQLTKGGLDAVTRGLAIEYATQGIRVNAVAPGIIKTPMHNTEMYEFLNGLHPVGRMGDVDDIANAVIYLEQAGFVTGETINVDGGQHAGRW